MTAIWMSDRLVAGGRVPAAVSRALRSWLPEWLPRWLPVCLGLGLVYGIVARIGLAYSSLAPNVTLIWAPTGIALFAVLRWGPRLWPAIVVGDVIANLGTGVPWWAIGGISMGNIAQAVLCAWALGAIGFEERLQRTRDVVALMALGTAGAAVSATVGVAALALAASFDWSAYPSVWLQWLMGDATGVVVVTPLLLAWWRPATAGIVAGSPARKLEGALLLLTLLALCEAIFGRGFDWVLPLTPGYYPVALALFPIAVWAALRFGLRGATVLTLLVSVAAVWGTVRGIGPFVDGAQTSSLLRWWVFANVITITSLLLSASQNERDQARVEAIRDRDFTTAILDAEGALVVVLDEAWRITRVNRAFESLTGFGVIDLVGQRFDEALIPIEQHAKFGAYAEMLRLNLSRTARHESLLRRFRGPPVTVSWTTSVLRDARGRIEHTIVSGVDISARVEANAALRQARRELEVRVTERTRALAQANGDLQIQMAERARLEREIIAINERTQQRFGQELHDGLGQHLTATAFQAELLAQDLQAAGIEDAHRCARGIESMLSDAVAQTRLLARGLFPVEIEADGLMAALSQLADTTRRLARRECELECPQAVPLRDHAVAVQLYRIAQEAVNNAVKHAPGASIRIRLNHDDDLSLRVINRTVAATAGAGGRIDPAWASELPPERGMGLRIMQHRAHLIAAALTCGVVDGFWQVCVTVPRAGIQSTETSDESPHA